MRLDRGGFRSALALGMFTAGLALGCSSDLGAAGDGGGGRGDGGGGGGGDDAPIAARGPSATITSEATSPATCDTGVEVYAHAADGTLGVALFEDPAGGGAGASTFTPVGGTFAGRTVIPNGHRVVYAIDADGALTWQRRVSGDTWADGAGAVIATGFDAYKQVISGGDGILYALTAEGALHWYRHLDPYAGADAWADRSGDEIATGWTGVARLVGGGDGLVYAVLADGSLVWHRHVDPFFGAATWAPGDGGVIGTGWDAAAGVTSAGGGVLYALLPDGTARWFRHLDPAGGAASWSAAEGREIAAGLVVPGATSTQLSACLVGAGPPVTIDLPQLRSGVHPDASDALRAVGVVEGGITQSIGSAAASAGTHAQDGTAEGLAYSCATDVSVRGMSDAEIEDLIERLGQLGFAPWFRKPGRDGWPADEAPHLHVVWAAAPMKASLRAQIRDFLVGKNGLASHTTYTFHAWSPFAIDRVRKAFLANNRGVE